MTVYEDYKVFVDAQKKFRLKKHLSESLEGGLPEEMTLDRWVAEF